MPIEFRCSRCQKLLRTPDDTAGKQAQCPQCGEVQTIPPQPAAAPPAQPVGPPPQLGNPFDLPNARQAAGWGPAVGYNPYQSPQAATAPPIQSWPASPRQGPPWEAAGPSPASFWSTIKAFFSDVAGFFATMRVQGGIGLPLLYMTICSILGGAAYAVQQGVFLALGVALPGAMQQEAAETGQAIAMVVGFSFCAAPVGAIFASFIVCAIYHLMLAMLGGANHGLEATYRVVAYSFGNSYLMYLIPCCGNYIGGLASIALTIIGLAYAHDTSGWRASGAVLIPMAVCCVGTIGLVVALIGVNA